MMKDLVDRINAVLEKLDQLTVKVTAMSEDIEDICGELFGDEESEALVPGQVNGRQPPDLSEFENLDLNSTQKPVLIRQ